MAGKQSETKDVPQKRPARPKSLIDRAVGIAMDNASVIDTESLVKIVDDVAGRAAPDELLIAAYMLGQITVNVFARGPLKTRVEASEPHGLTLGELRQFYEGGALIIRDSFERHLINPYLHPAFVAERFDVLAESRPMGTDLRALRGTNVMVAVGANVMIGTGGSGKTPITRALARPYGSDCYVAFGEPGASFAYDHIDAAWKVTAALLTRGVVFFDSFKDFVYLAGGNARSGGMSSNFVISLSRLGNVFARAGAVIFAVVNNSGEKETDVAANREAMYSNANGLFIAKKGGRVDSELRDDWNDRRHTAGFTSSVEDGIRADNASDIGVVHVISGTDAGAAAEPKHSLLDVHSMIARQHLV